MKSEKIAPKTLSKKAVAEEPVAVAKVNDAVKQNDKKPENIKAEVKEEPKAPAKAVAKEEAKAAEKKEAKAPAKAVAKEEAKAAVKEEPKTATKKKAAVAKKTKETEKKDNKKNMKKKSTTKKDTTKKAVTNTMETKVVLQCYGTDIEPKVLLEQAKADYIAAGGKEKNIKSLELYIKPEDNAAYYVINGEPAGKVIIFG